MVAALRVVTFPPRHSISDDAVRCWAPAAGHFRSALAAVGRLQAAAPGRAPNTQSATATSGPPRACAFTCQAKPRRPRHPPLRWAWEAWQAGVVWQREGAAALRTAAFNGCCARRAGGGLAAAGLKQSFRQGAHWRYCLRAASPLPGIGTSNALVVLGVTHWCRRRSPAHPAQTGKRGKRLPACCASCLCLLPHCAARLI